MVDGADVTLQSHILHSHLLLDWFWPAVRGPGIFIDSGLLLAAQGTHRPLQPVPDQLIPRVWGPRPDRRWPQSSSTCSASSSWSTTRLGNFGDQDPRERHLLIWFDYYNWIQLLWQVLPVLLSCHYYQALTIWRRVCSSSINWIEIRVVFKVKIGRIILGRGRSRALHSTTGNTKPRQSIRSNSIKVLRWSCWLVVADSAASGWSYYSQFATFVTSQLHKATAWARQ